MAKGIKKFLNANKFPWETFKKYWKYSSYSELIADVLLPIVISSGIIWWTSVYVFEFGTLIEKFQQLSGQVIAAISILAGFNITSITVISSVGDNAERLRERRSSDNQINYYDMLIVFFTWAVTIQLIVVLTSIVLFYLGSLVPSTLNISVPIWGWICAVVWLAVTLHSIMISIRNLKTLFLYVTYKKPENTGEN